MKIFDAGHASTVILVAVSALPSLAQPATNPDQSCATLLETAQLVAPLQTITEMHSDTPWPVIVGAENPESHVVELYGSEDEDILFDGSRISGSIASDGDDRVFVFEAGMPQMLSGEGGADMVYFCSLAQPVAAVTFNSSMVMSDSEPDTLVVGPDAFRQATDFGPTDMDWGGRPETIEGARILVAGFDPRTDRVILRPPWPVDLRLQENTPFSPSVLAGPIELQFAFFEMGIDPLPAVSVSITPEDETIAGVDLDTLLSTRVANKAASKTGMAGLAGILDSMDLGDMTEDHGDENGFGHSDGHGDDYKGDHGEAHGNAGFARVAEDYAAERGCGAGFSVASFSEAALDHSPDAYDPREATWRDTADRLAYFGDGVPQYLGAGGGDDLLWLFDVEEGTEIEAGDGADLVILCSVEDTSATIWFERGDSGVDDVPDTLVIGPMVLDGIPSGFERTIALLEFDPRVDRLVLPEGPWDVTIESYGRVLSRGDTSPTGSGFDPLVSYGPLRVRLGLGQYSDPATLFRAISVGDPDPAPHLADLVARVAAIAVPPVEFRSVDPAGWASARSYGGAETAIAAPVFDCGAPPAATPRPAQPDMDEHDALFHNYGPEDDVIIVTRIADDPDTGILSGSELQSGDGEDLVYSYTSNAILIDGAGADLTLLCDVDRLETTVIVPNDGSPDQVIIDAAIFRKPVTTGFLRRINVIGLGEPDDTLILRLPEAAKIERNEDVYKIVTPLGTTEIAVSGYFYDSPDDKLTPERILVWPET